MIFLNYNLLQIINKLFIKIISKIEKKKNSNYIFYIIYLFFKLI